MNSVDYWNTVHRDKYPRKDWVNKTTIFAKQVLPLLPKQGRLLELGAGQGQDSRFFAKQFDVTSTDLTEQALTASKQKATDEGLHITFEQVDLNKPLPFKDEEFNVVYSHLGLHYFNKEQTRKIFQEIHRVLKPNGTVAALFNTLNDPETQDSGFEQIEEHYYLEKKFGLYKAFFSKTYIQTLTDDLFTPTLLDEQGETHKDEIKTLVRFVGEKIG